MYLFLAEYGISHFLSFSFGESLAACNWLMWSFFLIGHIRKYSTKLFTDFFGPIRPQLQRFHLILRVGWNTWLSSCYHIGQSLSSFNFNRFQKLPSWLNLRHQFGLFFIIFSSPSQILNCVVYSKYIASHKSLPVIVMVVVIGTEKEVNKIYQ